MTSNGVAHSVKFWISRLNVFPFYINFHSFFRPGYHTILQNHLTKTLYCGAKAVRGLSCCAEAIKGCWLRREIQKFTECGVGKIKLKCHPLRSRSFLKNQKIHFLKTCSSPSPTMWELSPDPKILVLGGPWPELWPRTRKWTKNGPKMVIFKSLVYPYWIHTHTPNLEGW